MRGSDVDEGFRIASMELMRPERNTTTRRVAGIEDSAKPNPNIPILFLALIPCEEKKNSLAFINLQSERTYIFILKC